MDGASAVLPSILIGCPVRNRAWILPDYLAALEGLDYPAERLRFAFIVNDCTDDTPRILSQFAARRQTLLVTHDLAHPRWERGYYSYRNLAQLRNRLLDALLTSGADYLFSVDSDVIVPPHALRRLLQAQRPIVGARVPNDVHLTDRPKRYNFLRYDTGRKRMTHVTGFPEDEIIGVDVVGAAVLIHRSVVEAGCRYKAAFTGEDEGFCQHAGQMGFHSWADTGLRCVHRMVPGKQQESEGG